MSKRLFQILDEMNELDSANGSEFVAISNHLLAADKVKQGGKITMGVDEKRFNKIMSQCLGGKQTDIVILCTIDKAKYEEILKESEKSEG